MDIRAATAGREKRAIVLPAALSRHSPTGAKLEDGKLEISFDTDKPEPPAAAEAEPAQDPVPANGETTVTVQLETWW